MSEDTNLRTSDGEQEYVDIHGRKIPCVIYEKTGEPAFPLLELKQTGVGIYQKTQYAKLATVDKQFTEDFNLFMLESAKQFMLANKIAFPEEQIVKAINNCKKMLSEDKKPPLQKAFLKNRLVEESPDNDLLIQVKVSETSPVTSSPPATSRKSVTPRTPRKLPEDFLYKDPDQLNSQLAKPTLKQNDKKPELEERKKDEELNQQRPKLRQPKAKTLEKVVLDEHRKKEHDVVVTCIHKRNCIWVRDKANQEIFNIIHRLVNEEAKHQKPARRPWQQEKVYMAPDEGFWFRCKIMRFNPLTVFFLDYGNMAEVDEIREVSEELAAYPCMAVRLTFKESEYDPCLEDEIKIKILKQNEDTTYFVNVLKKTKKSDIPPQTASNQTKADEKTPWQFSKVAEEAPRDFFKLPPPLVSLKDGLRVVVIHVENGVFYLRTKDCFAKLKQIERDIEEYVKSAQSPKKVQVDQLVLAPDDFDEVYHRAVVTAVKDKRAEVKFLDYCEKTAVDTALLKNIDESLSLEPITYLRGKQLKGFENGDFSDDDKALIGSMVEKRKKFVVVLDEEGDFDLFDGSVRLSQLLKKEKDGVKRLRLQDMKTYKPEFGVNTYLCGCYRSSSEFAVVPSAELEQYIDSVLISDVKDSEPYSPISGEVCFCYFMDQWYRCVVTRVLNDEFEVVLLDFGNVELVKRDDLRRPSGDITEVPALALPCKLINLPKHPKVEDLLKKLVIEGELYKVDVKSINEGKCEVEIPTVYHQIQKTPS